MLLNRLRRYPFLLLTCVLMLSACSTAESSLKPSVVNAENDVPQNVSTSTLVLPTLAPTIIPTAVVSEPVGCKTIRLIAVCVQDVARTDTETQVKLKIVVESPMVSGTGSSFIFPDYQNGISPTLLDEQGNSYSLIEDADNNWAQFDDAERVYFQTLHFQPVLAGAKKLTVSLPMVAVDTPVKAETFQIDLGPDPQPGQARALDVTTTVDGQIFHFVKAEFGGDGVNSMLVTLHIEPLNLPEDVFWMAPAFGDPGKGVFFGQKFGASQIYAELVIPPGRSSGSSTSILVSDILNLRVDRITYWYSGPFEITYQLP